MPTERIPSFRSAQDLDQIKASLGLMSKLIGRWSGNGFNLIARPNFHDSTNLYLQLNKTLETFKVEPIGSPIPNRGFGQDDIQLFGAHSLQQITDAGHDGALHIEPGLWVTQGPTVYPPESPPAGAQIIYRMGSIPHGNALLAQGVAETFSGPPTLKSGTIEYSFSRFPSFNSTPFVIPPVGAPVMNADGTSEKLSAAANGVPPFTPYDVTIPASLANPRTPFDTSPPEPALPAALDGVAMQDVINDPIRLLQKRVQDQVDDGCTFEGVVFNIATQNSFTFLDTPNGAATGPTTTVTLPEFAGGIENTLFLEGGSPTGPSGANAQVAQTYATVWISEVSHPNRPKLIQLQYAQMVILAFPIFAALHPPAPNPPRLVNLGWPHISVGTLQRAFG